VCAWCRACTPIFDAHSPARQRADGILLDLGVSSAQIDERERGFRMRTAVRSTCAWSASGETAAQLIARADLDSADGWLRELGEVASRARVARAILRARTWAACRPPAICARRSREPLVAGRTRRALARVSGAAHRGPTTSSPIFAAFSMVCSTGSIPAAASYHQLSLARGPHGEAVHARCECGMRVSSRGSDMRVRANAAHPRMLTRRALGPRDQEIARNPRSRSAHLRAAEKVVPDAA
jgi:16S rRNA (cytosine1402-N4)-methyltransferase